MESKMKRCISACSPTEFYTTAGLVPDKHADSRPRVRQPAQCLSDEIHIALDKRIPL